MTPFLDDPPLAFAHRGGAAAGDENTTEAFTRAVAAGYTYVETDVHATRDGVAVVVHDETLDRVAGTPAVVADMTYKDLQRVPVGACVIPRLDDVLARWPEVRFNLDVKSDAAVEPTVAAIRTVNCGDRTLLASFSDRRLRRLRTGTQGKIVTSLSQREASRFWLASRIGRRIGLDPTVVAIQVPVFHGRLRVVDRRLVALAHRLGIHVHVWTVDDPAEMAGLLDLGVDGIMTDRIDVLRDVFVHRGLWKDSR